MMHDECHHRSSFHDNQSYTSLITQALPKSLTLSWSVLLLPTQVFGLST